MLSLQLLIAAQGAPTVIPENLISIQKRLLEEYHSKSNVFFVFYFSIGSTAETSDNAENENKIATGRSVQEKKLLISTGRSKIFKPSKAKNLPRRAPRRLPTAYRSLASTKDQWEAAVAVEEAARKNAMEKAACFKAETSFLITEQTTTVPLVSARYLNADDKLTKKALLVMFTMNADLMRELKVNTASSKSATVDVLLHHISKTKLVLKENHV